MEEADDFTSQNHLCVFVCECAQSAYVLHSFRFIIRVHIFVHTKQDEKKKNKNNYNNTEDIKCSNSKQQRLLNLLYTAHLF